MSEITRLLVAVENEVPHAAAELFDLVYEDLRCLATGCLAKERTGHTLQPTALVNETYLRLFRAGRSVEVDAHGHFENRRHFFAAAAEAMRRILVESARKKSRLKRGGDRQRVLLDPNRIGEPEMADELLALDDALSRLATIEPKIAELVRLRFFAGLTVREAAQQVGVSPRTADSQWAYARAWLLAEIRGDD